MSRFIFVVQESTPRCFPLPPTLDLEVKKSLIKELTVFRSLKTPVTMTPAGASWYDSWYRQRAGSRNSDKHFAGYYERKPDHLIRIAIILRVSSRATEMTLTEKDLLQANRILCWLEEWFPNAFDQLSSSANGEDQSRILRQLRQAGGTIEHSMLLRKNSARLNSEQFKRALQTLREAKLVDWDPIAKTYFLTSEGWK